MGVPRRTPVTRAGGCPTAVQKSWQEFQGHGTDSRNPRDHESCGHGEAGVCGRGICRVPCQQLGTLLQCCCAGGAWGGPSLQFGVLLVPLAEFPSSPHCRLPGNTTCQQNAVGLMKLPPLRILQSQAEGIILEGDWPPIPVAGGRAVILGLEGWKTAGYSSRCGGTPGQSCEILVCYSPVGICVAVGSRTSSVHGSALGALTAQREPSAFAAHPCAP